MKLFRAKYQANYESHHIHNKIYKSYIYQLDKQIEYKKYIQR